MCGIAGVLSLGGGAAPTRAELADMIGTLRHRGPDGTGYFCDGVVGLASARLSIIDIATGDQPVHNEDKSVWVVFNGEIFNYLELRDDLTRAGHRFSTQSDTEVIVHLYEEHGDKFVERLNGQFAIALWDTRKQRVVFARDRVGIRPLFFVRVEKRIAFASEVKALFALPSVPRHIDPTALAEIFTYWGPIGGRTPFAGIESLPAGHIMVVDETGTRVSAYWDWDFPADPVRTGASVRENAEELRALLVDAVRLQLRSDVPVGAYLSGGLDSSAIAALVRAHSNAPLRTFSVTFEDAEFDESAAQQEMARHLGTDHTSIVCSRASIAALFPATIWHTESPIVRTAPTPLMLLASHVRAQNFKVVLTGEGADEVFGGYDLFKEARLRRLMARWPGERRGPALLKQLYPYLRHSPAASSAFAERFFRDGVEHVHEPWFAHIPRWTTTGRIAQFFSPRTREAVSAFDPYRAIAATLPSAIGRWPPLAQDQYVEAHTLLTGYLLSSQGDRMSMAHSVEGRVPYLDHRVIEFANGLPPRFKLHGLTEKHVLREAVRGLVPESVRMRTKQPYRAPDSASFFTGGRPVGYVADLLSPERVDGAGYFDSNAIGKLVAKCAAGRAIGFGDNMAFVGVLSTMLLHTLFVDGVPPSAIRP